MSRIISYKSASIWKEDNGIVFFKANEDDIYDSDDLKNILDIMAALNQEQSFRLVMDSNGYEFLMTKEARELFNTYDRAVELIIAEAVVINSTTTMILYNLLTMVYKPKFPFKAFTDVDKAVGWLLQFGD